jgi:predicted metal-dependent hydrolase
VQLELPFVRVVDISPPQAPLLPSLERQRDPLSRIEFVRMRRARRYVLRVRPDGTLRVTVPRGGSRREAEAFVTENLKWIERERRRVDAEHAPVEWHPGSRILLRGEFVTIGIERRASSFVVVYGERQIETDRVGNLRALIESDLRQLARVELIPRLHELATKHALAVGAVTIRNQRSRWGSCARNGNIALNFRLVQMPRAVCEYVLIHELMHIRQQNHSRRFWRLVEAAFPAFREAERWLRTTGRSLL